MEHIKIVDKEWFKVKEKHPLTQWSSYHWCEDGDAATAYIDNEEKSVMVQCFSGMPASFIEVSEVDFGTVLRKAGWNGEQVLSFTEQCIWIADYLCNLFCSYKKP